MIDLAQTIAPTQRTDRAPNLPSSGLTPAAAQAALVQAYRYRRVPLWLPISVLGVWSLALATAVLLPVTYSTTWSLILPTSTSASTVALESIGQSTVQPGQPFSNVTLSPKVVYREILGSDRLADDAARRMGLTRAEFGRVRVRSVDETSLLNLEITGRTPEETFAKAIALNDAFAQKLDSLRADEADRRASSVRDSLRIYEVSLRATRERILAFQRETGFLSSGQFSDAAQAAEQARRKVAEIASDIEKISQERATLTRRLGVPTDDAGALLKIAADPAFQALARSYADANAAIQEGKQRFGARHPSVAIAEAKRAGVFDELKAAARTQGLSDHLDRHLLGFAAVASQQAEFLRTLVQTEPQIEGRRAELAAIRVDLARLERDATRMSGDAARLEGLKKEQLVAEAVYTSAAARLDTNRSDIYASYPLVQVLALPEAPTSPRRLHWIFAIAAGIVGTVFLVFAWGLAWARTRFNPIRSKNASSK